MTPMDAMPSSARQSISASALHELRVAAPRPGPDLDQPLRVGAVRRADHEDGVGLRGHGLHGLLPVRRRVADVFLVRPDDGREAGLQGSDHRGRVVHAERRLRHVGQPVGVAHPERGDVPGLLDQEHVALGELAHRAHGLRVAGMADHHHLEAVLVVAGGLDMDLRHQGAGRVDIDHLAARGLRRDGLGHAMGAEDDGTVGRAVVQLLDEDGPLVAQAVDDVAVMDDLVAHVDGRAPFLERHLHDLDGAVDARAEAARRGQIQRERRFGPFVQHGHIPSASHLWAGGWSVQGAAGRRPDQRRQWVGTRARAPTDARIALKPGVRNPMPNMSVTK